MKPRAERALLLIWLEILLRDIRLSLIRRRRRLAAGEGRGPPWTPLWWEVTRTLVTMRAAARCVKSQRPQGDPVFLRRIAFGRGYVTGGALKRHDVVFVTPFKCGKTALGALALRLNDHILERAPKNPHVTTDLPRSRSELISERQILHGELEGKHVIAIVRCPWRRFASMYRYLQKQFQMVPDTETHVPRESAPMAFSSEVVGQFGRRGFHAMSFSEFAHFVNDIPLSRLDKHWAPQAHLLGASPIHTIYRLEDLRSQVAAFQREVDHVVPGNELDVSPFLLRDVNATVRTPATGKMPRETRELYEAHPDVKDIVAKKYADDIRLFRYADPF